jgi:hypothetical protein
MNVIDYILLAVAGLSYFRATVTSARDFGFWRSMVGYGTPIGPADARLYNHVHRLGPLPITDLRVVVLTLLLFIPFVFAPRLASSWVYAPIVCVAVAAYLSPLTAPSLEEPEADDLSDFGKFIAKWMASKFDIYLKMTAAGVALWLIGKIPVIGDFPAKLGEMIFPVIKETHIGHEVLDVAPTILAAMLLMRFLMFAVYGYWYTTLALLSCGWIWFQFQWLFGELLERSHSALDSFTHWTLLTIACDFLLSLLTAISGRLIRRQPAGKTE